MEKEQSFQQILLKQLDVYMEKYKPQPHITTSILKTKQTKIKTLK